MINKLKCDRCIFEEICEYDTIIDCDYCQDVIPILCDDEKDYYWCEMSYRKYSDGLLDFSYSEYSDGEWTDGE